MEISPQFNVRPLADDELPSRLRSNGSVNIDRERVAEIAGIVIDGYKEADIQMSGIVGQTADDEQVIIIPPNQEYSFDGPIFDITSIPNGNLLIPDFATIKEINNRNGSISDLITLPIVEGPGAFGAKEVTFINGLSSIGGGSFFASRSALDLALGGALFQVSPGNSQLIGDIESFTLGDGRTVIRARFRIGKISDVSRRVDTLPALRRTRITSQHFQAAKSLLPMRPGTRFCS